MAYNAEDEKANALPAFDANRAKSRANKLQALQSYVAQNQSTSAPNALKTKAIQSGNTVANVNKAQGAANALTIQQGTAVEEQTKKDTTGSGLEVSKIALDKSVSEPKARVITDHLAGGAETVESITNNGKVNQTGTVIDSSVTSDIAAVDAQKTKIIGPYTTLGRTLDEKALADLAKLDAQTAALRAKLNALPTTGLADIGQTNVIENTALDDADSLTATPTSNVGYLQRMFGPDYNSKKFGGLDSQVYNEDVNDARKVASDNTSEMVRQKSGKITAAKSYLGSVKSSKDTMDSFDTDFKKSVEDNKVEGKKTLKGFTDDVDTDHKTETTRIREVGDKLKRDNLATAKEVDEAKTLLGEDFGGYAANLGKKFGGSFGDDVDSIQRAKSKVIDLLKKSPTNSVLTKIQNAIENHLASAQKRKSEKDKIEADKRAEEAAYAKRNKSDETRDSSSVRKSEERADKDRSSSKDNFASKEKPDKADRSKN